MKSPVCEMFGIEFPILAFSHCRDVVAAVSKAGGLGVLGVVHKQILMLMEQQLQTQIWLICGLELLDLQTS